MGVFAAEGRFGSGKSAYCVWLALTFSARRGGCPIWANFSLKGAIPIRTIADLYTCEGGVIVIDELQGTIHARVSAGSANLEFLEWFDQCRKQDSDVICITQAFHKIDVIVREMIEIGFSCQNADIAETVFEPKKYVSKIAAIDMDSGRELSAFRFDRSVSFEYYNHKERAWKLEKKPTEKVDRNRARDGPSTRPEAALAPR
jgi:hypothetical protein